MKFEKTQRIGEIAARCPGTVLILEKAGVEFAARGKRTLEVACDHDGVDVDDLLQELDSVEMGDVRGEDDLADWYARPMSALVDFLSGQDHRCETKELARLNAQFASLSESDMRLTEVRRIRRIFVSLSNTLPPHMLLEERELFPYIEKLEAGVREFETDAPVRNPVLIQYIEHDTIASKIEKIRLISSNFSVPAEASQSLRALYRDLEKFERHCLRHLHLENNVLFPRALEMENALRGKGAPENDAPMMEARH